MNNKNYVSIEKVENGYTVDMFVVDEGIETKFDRLKRVTFICTDLEDAFELIEKHYGEKT
jgi:hypothetical protein